MTDIDEDAIESAKTEALFPQDRDWLLVSLVRYYANNGVEIGITLNVGGLVISGTLISGKTYLTEMSEQFEGLSQDPEDFSKIIAKGFSGYLPIYDKSEDENGVPVSISYLHLRDAKVFTPSGSLPGGKGPLWRGRMESVNGFSIGTLKPD